MFRQAFFDAAVASYQKALDISSPNAKSQRAIYHANIAACYIQKVLFKVLFQTLLNFFRNCGIKQ